MLDTRLLLLHYILPADSFIATRALLLEIALKNPDLKQDGVDSPEFTE